MRKTLSHSRRNTSNTNHNRHSLSRPTWLVFNDHLFRPLSPTPQSHITYKELHFALPRSHIPPTLNILPPPSSSLLQAVAAARAEAILEIPIVVAVDVCEGSWVEGCGLNKRTELNGARGCVEQVNIKPATGGAVKVGFSEHGSVWMRPSNLIFIANDSSPVADDAASIGTSLVSSRVQSPSEHHGSNARSASHSALNDSCYSADSSNPAGHPNPVPLKRSRNEGYERFKREKLKLHLKRDTLIFNAHLVVPPHSHPVSLYHSTWPKWQLELQDTKALRPGVGTL